MEVHLQPLSFAEIVSAAGKAGSGKDIRTLWNRYVRFGGFPYAQEFVHDELAADTYLEGLFNTIVVKDVVQRRKISDAASLERIVRLLFDNIGNVTTVKAICDALSAGGRKLAPQTVDSYIEGLCDALDDDPPMDYDGIRQISAFDFFLGRF